MFPFNLTNHTLSWNDFWYYYTPNCYLVLIEYFFRRWKYPQMERPIKVHLSVPIIFVIICIFLLILPVIESPLVLLGGILITLSGVPVYYFGIMQDQKTKKLDSFMSKYDHYQHSTGERWYYTGWSTTILCGKTAMILKMW